MISSDLAPVVEFIRETPAPFLGLANFVRLAGLAARPSAAAALARA
jgi:hypothetical protein